MKTEDIISLVSQTKDETLGLTLGQMAIQPEITLTERSLHVSLKTGFPSHALSNTLLEDLKKILNKNLPNYDINLTLHSVIKAHQTQLPGKGLKNIKNVIAVGSGKGGVGKSTLSVNLALALAKAEAKVGILDADIYGSSIPLMLGEAKPLSTEGDYYFPVRAHGIQAMSIGYLTPEHQALLWRGPMLAKMLIHLLDFTRWDELDYLIIDLPPGTGDIQLSLVQKIPLTGAIVVTTPQNAATSNAQKLIELFKKTNIDILGLVENMSLHSCSQCGYKDVIFGQNGGKSLSQSFQIPLLGQLPLDASIQEGSDAGNPVILKEVPLAQVFFKIALSAAITIANKPLNYSGKFPPVVIE